MMEDDSTEEVVEHDLLLVDETAIARALQGDRSVWASLTRLEREETILRAVRKRQAEQAENAEWSPVLRMVGAKAKQYRGEPRFLPHPTRNPQWLLDVTHAAGYADPKCLTRQARRIERRRASGG